MASSAVQYFGGGKLNIDDEDNKSLLVNGWLFDYKVIKETVY